VDGVGIDPQPRVGQVVGEDLRVDGRHHHVVVAVGDEGGVCDPGKPVELGRVWDAGALEDVGLLLASLRVDDLREWARVGDRLCHGQLPVIESRMVEAYSAGASSQTKCPASMIARRLVGRVAARRETQRWRVAQRGRCGR